MNTSEEKVERVSASAVLESVNHPDVARLRAVLHATLKKQRSEVDGHRKVLMLVYFVLRQRYTVQHAQEVLGDMDGAGDPMDAASLAELTPEELEDLLRAVVERSGVPMDALEEKAEAERNALRLAEVRLKSLRAVTG